MGKNNLKYNHSLKKRKIIFVGRKNTNTAKGLPQNFVSYFMSEAKEKRHKAYSSCKEFCRRGRLVGL